MSSFLHWRHLCHFQAWSEADEENSDMSHYHAYVTTLRNKPLLQFFISLRELAQIYLIAPSDAKALATVIADRDRFLGIFQAEEVYEFATRRADWYTVKGEVEKGMYGFGCALM